MKRIIALALAACLILCFAGCGNEAGKTDGTVDMGTPSKFYLTYQGAEIRLTEPMAPILQKLGEPKKYTESASCAFEGLDKTYFYGSFYLETYPQGDEDFIYGWWFADDTISTPEGIFIGASKMEVELAYGAENFNGTNAYTIKDGNGTLTIIMENDVVSSIQCTLNVA